MRGDVEDGRNGEQDRDRPIGVQQIAARTVEQQQAGERQARHHPKTGQRCPQLGLEHHQIDQTPQRGEHCEQKGEQANAVDNQGRAALAEQQWMASRAQQMAKLAGLEFAGQQRAQATAQQVENRWHLLLCSQAGKVLYTADGSGCRSLLFNIRLNASPFGGALGVHRSASAANGISWPSKTLEPGQ